MAASDCDLRSAVEPDTELADATIRRVTADIAMVMAVCPPCGPEWQPAGVSPQDYFAATVAQLDWARLHAPGDSTLWYLRAMVAVLLDDEEVAERSLRRVNRIEADRTVGDAMKARRLGLIERDQGIARRMTDGLLRKGKYTKNER